MSFAGLVSAGIGGIVYFFLFPHLLVGIVGAKTFIAFCGLLGSGLQQTLAGIFNNFITPAGRYILYYEKLLEINVLQRRKIISEDKAMFLIEKLTDERFLGISPTNSSRQLPSGPKD